MPPCLRASVPCHAGFSLLELMIVLVIMAVVAGLALPRYASAVSRYRADAAAKRIAADLALARSQAMTTSRNQVVSFDVAASSYQLPGVSALEKKANTYAVSLSADPYRAALVSVDFGGQPSVTFNLYGTPNCGGTITLSVGSNQKSVILDAAGGATIP